ncbi:hypothetical protein KO528_07595 [Saccharophagus degradans]|uniref:hypothetical protein n=1 Tax=Saccharophagus degradans TaxID=86304 RepID=UPI001C09E20D|nr:hypothetical protein [Saccharophagus degradans]MBU2985210.1 hypothetical protein [Saccharophagus degradans]
MIKIILLIFLFISASASSQVASTQLVGSWGYETAHNTNYLDSYCIGSKEPVDSVYQNIRSKNTSVEIGDAYYRYTLGREVFATDADAERRVMAINNPKNRNSKQSKMCDIRKAFRDGSVVYFIHTDVGAFRSEMHRLNSMLFEAMQQPAD